MIFKDYIVKHSFRHPIVLFDGECMLCNQSVQWLIKHDKNQILKFHHLQTSYLESNSSKTINSVILLHNGNKHDKSAAIIQIFVLLGGTYKLISFIFGIFPKAMRDIGYDFIAKYRYKWYGKYNTCEIPAKQWQDRFLDKTIL
ncbi:MAG: DUF393 domain-containing protein [Saprospiraceae bacterium]|jgi:predicted DCC family thiol-disulfide oxidoreductase YuxK|nr:DUF393 domain-containing protein [Saprospiraceae bacterium]